MEEKKTFLSNDCSHYLDPPSLSQGKQFVHQAPPTLGHLLLEIAGRIF